MRIARPALVAVTITVSLAASLSACAGRPGTAAVVEGTTISQSELETAQQEIVALIPGVSASAILGNLIGTPIFVQVAQDNGVGVSIDDAKALLAAKAAEVGLPTDHDYGTGAIDIARVSIAVDNLSQLADGEAILAEAQAAIGGQEITVNPRYGTFDPASAQLLTVSDPDWIVQAPTQ